MSWIADLHALKPCQEALEWASRYPSLDAAWEACERADWMLWLLSRPAKIPAVRNNSADISNPCPYPAANSGAIIRYYYPYPPKLYDAETP